MKTLPRKRRSIRALGHPQAIRLQDRVGDGGVPGSDQLICAFLLGIRRHRKIGDRHRLPLNDGGAQGILRVDLPHAELVGCTIAGIPGADQISDFAIDIADGWHNRRPQRGLREAVDYFLRHHRADVPRLMLTEAADLFAASRQQSGLSAHYVSQCRKTVSGDGRFKSCGLLRTYRFTRAKLPRLQGGSSPRTMATRGIKFCLCSTP